MDSLYDSGNRCNSKALMKVLFFALATIKGKIPQRMCIKEEISLGIIVGVL